ncbi:SlyX family protein [Magnetospirillum aberrantis]|uniref:Protein SlyX homolog n=1 Tax=Magnetospirillum aberrantis SpK TaxID=908842 RepID=A0A7C9UU85_9PROT|nr:SlyX family protein [Magnetospirillum aberrantis]NFV78592.1 SlyX family protein [Magnetospirillum aberrantis SpK]
MDEMLEQRLIELETRIAYYERMAEDLSSVIADQGNLIDVLNERVRRLTGRLREVESGWDRSPQDDKPPPHY